MERPVISAIVFRLTLFHQPNFFLRYAEEPAPFLGDDHVLFLAEPAAGCEDGWFHGKGHTGHQCHIQFGNGVYGADPHASFMSKSAQLMPKATYGGIPLLFKYLIGGIPGDEGVDTGSGSGYSGPYGGLNGFKRVLYFDRGSRFAFFQNIIRSLVIRRKAIQGRPKSTFTRSPGVRKTSFGGRLQR